MEAQVGLALRVRGWTLALAESCTGGLVAHRITEVAGSSDYFLGGAVAYSNPLKEKLLGVSPETLEAVGAVSNETALEMAMGARDRLGADVGLSITGIAGPGGGSEEKPVGLTYIALVTPESERVERYVFEGDRRANKEAAAEASMQLLLEEVIRDTGKESVPGLIKVDHQTDLDGDVRPVAFVWEGHRIPVVDIGRSWEEEGEQRYLIKTPGDRTFELAQALETGSWRIVRKPTDFGPEKTPS